MYFNKQLTNKHGGVLLVDGHVYGDSDDSGHPFCAEVKTGRCSGRRAREGEKSASVTYADGRLYFHYENGVVALVEASPEGYKEVGFVQDPQDAGAVVGTPGGGWRQAVPA